MPILLPRNQRTPRKKPLPHTTKITILTALYKAGPYIKTKLQNLQQLNDLQQATIILLNCQNLHNENQQYQQYTKHPNIKIIEYNNYTRLYQTWNDGIKTTNTPYITNSNVDDILHPNFIPETLNHLETNPQTSILTTGILITNQPNQLWPNWNHIIGKIPTHPYPLSTAGPGPIWKRQLHKKHGYFKNYRTIGDAKIWQTWHNNKETFNLINPDLILYYAHPQSLERRIDTTTNKTLQQLDQEDPQLQ